MMGATMLDLMHALPTMTLFLTRRSRQLTGSTVSPAPKSCGASLAVTVLTCEAPGAGSGPFRQVCRVVRGEVVADSLVPPDRQMSRGDATPQVQTPRSEEPHGHAGL